MPSIPEEARNPKRDKPILVGTPLPKQRTISPDLHNTIMRNWVIMSLCGFNNVLLNIMPIHFPNMVDDFLELSLHIDQIVAKLRKTLHQK